MITRTHLLLSTIYFLFSALVYAGSGGKSGFGFLKLVPDARSASVGGAVVTNYGPNSIFYNPAGLARVKKTELSFHHLVHFGEMPYESVAFSAPASFGGWSLGLNYFSVNDIPRTVFSSATPDRFQEIGETKASDLALALGMGGNVSGRLALGAGIKTVSEKLDNKSATAVMLDLGLIYVFYSKYDNAAPVKTALTFRNIGPDTKFSDAGVSLPMEASFGLSSHTRYAKDLWSRWSLELSRFFERGEDITLGKAGMEFTCAGMVNFGAGYRYQFRRLHLGKLAGFSFGAGVETSIVNFNYAWSPYGDLGDSHYFTLHWPLPYEARRYITGPETTNIPKITKLPAKPVSVKTEPIDVPNYHTASAVIPAKAGIQVNIAIADFEARDVSLTEASVVSDLIRSEFVKSNAFSVVDRRHMEKILAEQAFQLSGCTTECAVQVGKILNAQKMVVGSLAKLNDRYFININCVNVETGKIEVSESIQVPSLNKLSAVASSLARKTVNKLLEQ